MAARRPSRSSRHVRRRAGSSGLPWALALAALLLLAGAAGWFVVDRLSSRATYDEATLCPLPGPPPAALLILLDLTDPLRPAQAARLLTLLGQEVEEAPTHAMIAVGTVAPGAAGPLFALCKPETGRDASSLYQNPRLIADRFRDSFQAPLDALLADSVRAEPQDSSPILESLQALLSRTPFALDGEPLRLVLVSDLLQHSDLLSLYRGEGWDHFAASGGAERLSRNLGGAEVVLLRIPRPEAPARAREAADPFWARYLDAQGATPPFEVQTLGDL